MINKIKQLAGDTIIYGISGVITRFISVFLIPIYTRIFSPADYGVINLVSTTFILVSIVVVFGLDNSAAMWFWDREEEEERKKTFSSWFWSQFFLSCAVCLIILLISGSLSQLVLNSAEYSDLFVYAALSLPFTSFTIVFVSWMRARQKALNVVVFSVGSSLLTIGLSIYLVIYLRIGLKGVFLSQLIANGISAIAVIILMRKTLGITHFRLPRLKEMLKYSAPLVPASISFWLFNSASAYFINHFTSKSQVGLYQIGTSIAAICGLIFWAFLQAWTPLGLSIHKQPGAKAIYSMVFDLYCALGACLVLFIFLFAPEILSVLTTEAYLNAALIAGILSLNIFIANIAQITSIGCAIAKTNIPYLIGVIMGAVTSLIMYFILIPSYGKEGAGISTVSGSIVLVTYVTYRAQKLYNIPYKVKKNLILLLIMLALVFTSIGLQQIGDTYKLFSKCLLFFLFLLSIFYWNRSEVIRLLNRLKMVNLKA